MTQSKADKGSAKRKAKQKGRRVQMEQDLPSTLLQFIRYKIIVTK